MAFYILISLAIISASAILLVRSVLNAALCLVVCLLALAGTYVILNSEFLAIVQILVYAGGILLLIIFGIMITRHDQEHRSTPNLPALAAAIVLTALLWNAVKDIPSTPPNESPVQASQIGISLMTQYALPFEAAGLLLLVTLIGAMVTSSFRSRT